MFIKASAKVNENLVKKEIRSSFLLKIPLFHLEREKLAGHLLWFVHSGLMMISTALQAVLRNKKRRLHAQEPPFVKSLRPPFYLKAGIPVI